MATHCLAEPALWTIDTPELCARWDCPSSGKTKASAGPVGGVCQSYMPLKSQILPGLGQWSGHPVSGLGKALHPFLQLIPPPSRHSAISQHIVDGWPGLLCIAEITLVGLPSHGGATPVLRLHCCETRPLTHLPAAKEAGGGGGGGAGGPGGGGGGAGGAAQSCG